MFSQWAPLEVADSSCTIRHGLHNNQFYCSFFESPSSHYIYKLINTLITHTHISSPKKKKKKKERLTLVYFTVTHRQYKTNQTKNHGFRKARSRVGPGRLVAALPKPTRRRGGNRQSPRRKKEEGDPPLLISSHSNYRLRLVRHAAPPQKRVGFVRVPGSQTDPSDFTSLQQDLVPGSVCELADGVSGFAHRVGEGPGPHFVQHDAAALQQGALRGLRDQLPTNGHARTRRLRRLHRAPRRLHRRALTRALLGLSVPFSFLLRPRLHPRRVDVAQRGADEPGHVFGRVLGRYRVGQEPDFGQTEGLIGAGQQLSRVIFGERE